MALGPVDLDRQQLDMGLHKSKHHPPQTEYDLFLLPPQHLLATKADSRRASVSHPLQKLCVGLPRRTDEPPNRFGLRGYRA